MNTMMREARMRRDLSSVADQVQDLIERLGDEGSDRLQDLRDRASGWSSLAKSKALDLGSAARDGALQAAKATHGYVRENPWRAIGVGAAAGLLIGYLVVSRRR
jgi:ElaB/YqjD/DUF883 family membrane-anchored ribosome-binding protein